MEVDEKASALMKYPSHLVMIKLWVKIWLNAHILILEPSKLFNVLIWNWNYTFDFCTTKHAQQIITYFTFCSFKLEWSERVKFTHVRKWQQLEYHAPDYSKFDWRAVSVLLKTDFLIMQYIISFINCLYIHVILVNQEHLIYSFCLLIHVSYYT